MFIPYGMFLTLASFLISVHFLKVKIICIHFSFLASCTGHGTWYTLLNNCSRDNYPSTQRSEKESCAYEPLTVLVATRLVPAPDSEESAMSCYRLKISLVGLDYY